MIAPDGSIQHSRDGVAALSALVVDDQMLLAQLLAERLALEGFDTMVATTVAEAVQSCESRRHHVAFVDMALPDGSGAEVAAELRKRSAEIMVVLMTGFACSVEDPLLDGGQFDALLPKPWRPAELDAVLAALWRRQQ